MKKLLSLFAAASVMFSLGSCSSDDNGDGPTPVPANEVLSGQIIEDMTLTSDKIWELSGRVFVTEGATLTIEAGTIIKGQPGTGTNSSGLYIAQDGMINAVGSASAPIIFTATDDNIALGEAMGSNLTENDSELWGGVVILGNAPISVDAGTTAQIEGVPAAELLGQYGGNDVTDNRGTFKYVSIRHGGTSIDPAAGKDINGLTLGGVGNGTEISDIEIFANLDDGIEFFGGSVNVSNILVYKVGDDAIDIDQAYSGTISNFVVYTGSESDEVLEIDGPEGDTNADGRFTLKDGYAVADGGGNAADFKSKAQGSVSNVKWEGFTGGSGAIKIRASFDGSCIAKSDAYTNLVNDILTFENVEFFSVSVYDGDDKDACELPTGDDSYQVVANNKITKTTTSGASSAAFGWSLASTGGYLSSVVPTDNVLSGNITSDITLTSDIIWELSGRVFVTGGATLTIEPGTIIKGQPGTGTNSSGLYIAQDGMIDAVGSATAPIIFTSTDDDIEVGQLVGSNLTEDNTELWGGVVILGNAPISVEAGSTAQIEGVPAAEPLGQYGGDNATHNSGKFQFVSIRHGGTSIDPAAGKDINGLTLGGVGSGTQISNIEIFANLDDGIEFFGGSVNVSNVLVYKVGDDGIDIDQSFSGTVDNFMVVTGEDSDEAFEIDGPEGSLEGSFSLTNGTAIADGGGNAADFKSKAMGSINNVKWIGFTGEAGDIKFRASFDEACAGKSDAYTNLLNDVLTFTAVEFASINVYDGNTDDTCDVVAADQTAAVTKIVSETSTGSDATVFDAWTLSSINNLL